jgi:hypothetical protein
MTQLQSSCTNNLLDIKKEKDRPKIAKKHNILDNDIGKDKDDLIM